MNRNAPLFLIVAIAAAFVAVVGFVSAPQLTDPSPLTMGQAYVVMMGVSAWLTLCAVVFAAAAFVRES